MKAHIITGKHAHHTTRKAL